GKGVSFMEGTPEYHGKAPKDDLYRQAMEELGGDPALLDEVRRLRAEGPLPKGRPVPQTVPCLDLGIPRTYGAEVKTDNRSAFGSALTDVGALNYGREGRTPLLVFDCDLASSVKTSDFAAQCPAWFIQAGIQEHATATMAGAASTAGAAALWADFGVFGLSEVYNQQRLNDINEANVKTVLTHVGLDVGEDGMTHQAIDYIGLLRNTFRWRLVVPADPNQTDRATRWALGEQGCVCIAMGRSKIPVLLDESGRPAFGEGYAFRYGEAVLLRPGSDGTIFALGAMADRALAARDLLAEKGRSVALYSVSSPLVPDDGALKSAAARGPILTCEDHSVRSGMGSILAARMTELGLSAPFRSLGVHRYGESGPSKDVYAAMGLDGQGIAGAFEDVLKKR
ncbi:MAG TPA: transketolase, partial [Synergistaceae bacterium]|nr:transketolase [Synergistaceae bacterium]